MALDPEEIRKVVYEALYNAVKENGYKFEGWTAAQIADDLSTFDYVCCEFETEEMVPYVKEWFSRNLDRALE